MSLESALRILKLDSQHFSEKDLREKFKKCLLKSNTPLNDICESGLVLYKRLPTLIAGAVWQEIFGECMRDAKYSPEQLEFTITGFDSIVHQMLFKEVQLRCKADCVILRNTMKLKVANITVPYDRSKKSFGDILIVGKSLSRRVLSLVIEGAGAMVFIAFYFQNILMDFWNKLKNSDVKNFYLPKESLASQEKDFQEEVSTTSDTRSQESSYESLLSPRKSFSPTEDQGEPILTPPENSDSESLASPTKNQSPSRILDLLSAGEVITPYHTQQRKEPDSLPSPGRNFSPTQSYSEFEDCGRSQENISDDSNCDRDIGDGDRSPIIVSTKKRLAGLEHQVSTVLSSWDLSGFVCIKRYLF